jgi:hypothetical protein
MIETASSGSVTVALFPVSFFGENDIVALSPIYGAASAIAIRIVERRLALATVDSAVMTPVRARSATTTHTLSQSESDATSDGVTSMMI